MLKPGSMIFISQVDHNVRTNEFGLCLVDAISANVKKSIRKVKTGSMASSLNTLVLYTIVHGTHLVEDGLATYIVKKVPNFQ